MLRFLIAAGLAVALAACATAATTPARYDVLIRGGTVYDGSGGPPYRADLGVRDGKIAAIGDLAGTAATSMVDATGLAVAPGFINMLSWATESLIVDGRAMSDIKQGVTLEVFGEGWSMGPLNDAMKAEMTAQQGDLHFDITWTTLGEYLDTLVKRGISPNVASFVGAATVRIHELGQDNRAPDDAELKRMQALVREAMEQGALGVGSALIYAPASYAKSDEIQALIAAAAPYGGGYISHMRSEGDHLLEGIDELIGFSRATGAHAEVYHMKAAGRHNWPKMAQAVAKIQQARDQGLPVSANMYTYPAGGTGLNVCMDPKVQAGGFKAWVERLKQPKVRAQVVKDMFRPAKGWENLCFAATPDGMLLSAFKNEALKPLTGKTLAQVAKLRGKSPAGTVVDLIIEDDSPVGTIYFLMSEDNIRLGLSQPWLSLGSDEAAPAAEGAFLKSNSHPRAYGNFARFLGKYVREGKVATLPDAVRRLTSLPAENWKLQGRGRLAPGFAADVVVFNPDTIIDHATFENPAQYATGVRDVWVNGVQVLKDGEHTNARPGQVVKGPGWRKPR